jgi:predicted DNA-binding protein
MHRRTRMLALRLEQELEAKLSVIARVRGCTKSELVREAIVRMIADVKDLEMAEKTRRQARSSKSLRQLRKELGLEH